jgi:hypothetical protein
MKEFIIHTLIDITETKQYRKVQGNELQYQQQQNFAMMLQAIGMRANITRMITPSVETVGVSQYGFGTEFTKHQRVWTFRFFIEYDGAYTDSTGNEAGLLIEDLNFVPVITSLTETVDLQPAMFNTKSSDKCNTVISVVSDK